MEKSRVYIARVEAANAELEAAALCEGEQRTKLRQAQSDAQSSAEMIVTMKDKLATAEKERDDMAKALTQKESEVSSMAEEFSTGATAAKNKVSSLKEKLKEAKVRIGELEGIVKQMVEENESSSAAAAIAIQAEQEEFKERDEQAKQALEKLKQKAITRETKLLGQVESLSDEVTRLTPMKAEKESALLDLKKATGLVKDLREAVEERDNAVNSMKNEVKTVQKELEDLQQSHVSSIAASAKNHAASLAAIQAKLDEQSGLIQKEQARGDELEAGMRDEATRNAEVMAMLEQTKAHVVEEQQKASAALGAQEAAEVHLEEANNLRKQAEEKAADADRQIEDTQNNAKEMMKKREEEFKVAQRKALLMIKDLKMQVQKERAKSSSTPSAVGGGGGGGDAGVDGFGLMLILAFLFCHFWHSCICFIFVSHIDSYSRLYFILKKYSPLQTAYFTWLFLDILTTQVQSPIATTPVTPSDPVRVQ